MWSSIKRANVPCARCVLVFSCDGANESIAPPRHGPGPLGASGRELSCSSDNEGRSGASGVITSASRMPNSLSSLSSEPRSAAASPPPSLRRAAASIGHPRGTHTGRRAAAHESAVPRSLRFNPRPLLSAAATPTVPSYGRWGFRCSVARTQSVPRGAPRRADYGRNPHHLLHLLIHVLQRAD